MSPSLWPHLFDCSVFAERVLVSSWQAVRGQGTHWCARKAKPLPAESWQSMKGDRHAASNGEAQTGEPRRRADSSWLQGGDRQTSQRWQHLGPTFELGLIMKGIPDAGTELNKGPWSGNVTQTQGTAKRQIWLAWRSHIRGETESSCGRLRSDWWGLLYFNILKK